MAWRDENMTNIYDYQRAISRRSRERRNEKKRKKKKIPNKNRRDIINVSFARQLCPQPCRRRIRKTWQRDLISRTARPETFPFFEILFRGGWYDSAILAAIISRDSDGFPRGKRIRNCIADALIDHEEDSPPNICVNPIKKVASTKERNLSLSVSSVWIWNRCHWKGDKKRAECLEMREIVEKNKI